MIGIDTPEFILILAIALVVLGPKRLPEIARFFGKSAGELRKAMDGLKGSINIQTLESLMKEAEETPKKEAKRGDTPKEEIQEGELPGTEKDKAGRAG